MLSMKTTKAQLSQMKKKKRLSWLFPGYPSRIIRPIDFPVMLQIIGMLGTVGSSCFTGLFHLGVQTVSDL